MTDIYLRPRFFSTTEKPCHEALSFPPRHPRVLVLLLGVGFAALRESNEIWDSSVFSITLSVLLISILLAIHRAEKRRAFWLGFALFGSDLPGALSCAVD